MGLSRLWWIPAGAAPTEGAYVYYDAPGTLGTLAAAAAATGWVVIGEDLGTVEPWLREALAARGVLGTQMLWFERGWSNEPLAPQWWRKNSLVTVSTHDLPPAADLAGQCRNEKILEFAGRHARAEEQLISRVGSDGGGYCRGTASHAARHAVELCGQVQAAILDGSQIHNQGWSIEGDREAVAVYGRGLDVLRVIDGLA